MSFSLPSDEKQAMAAIARAKYFKFKKDEASEFAEKQGLPKLDSAIEMPVAYQEKEEDPTSPSPSVLDFDFLAYTKV